MPAIYYNKYNRKHFRAVWLNRRRDETLKWESVPGKQLRQLIPFRGGRRPPTTSANNERQQSLRSYTSTQAFAESALLHVNIDWFEWVKPNGNGNEMGLLWVQIGEFHRILARLGPRLQTLSRFIFAFRRIFAKFGQNGRLPMGLVWNGVGDRSLERLGSPFSDLVGRAALKTRFPIRLPRLNGPRVERTPRGGRSGCLRSDERGTCAQRT